MMLEGAGHRVTESASGRRPGDLMGLAELSGTVPMVCLVRGRPAGHGAVHRTALRLRGDDRDGLDLRGRPAAREVGHRRGRHEGGARRAEVAADVSGVVHNVVADDGEAISLARHYLSYFPLTRGTCHLDATDLMADPARSTTCSSSSRPTLAAPTPSAPCSRRWWTAASCSRSSRASGARSSPRSPISGDASQWPSSPDDPERSGPAPVDSNSADKAALLLDVAGAFGLSCVSWPTTPGCSPADRRRHGDLRHAARMFAVQHRLQVPKLAYTLHQAVGLRLVDHGDEPLRRSDHHARLPVDHARGAAGLVTGQCHHRSRGAGAAWLRTRPGHRSSWAAVFPTTT